MKKTAESNAVLRKTEKSLKSPAKNGLKTQQPLASAADESAPSQAITIPPRKRISPAADEEME